MSSRTGRPSTLEAEPETIERLISAVEAGHYLETAAASAGLHMDSVRRWLRRGGAAERRLDQGLPVDAGERVYLDFCRTFREAEARAEMSMVASIRDAAAAGDWRAAAHFLARRWPARWGREVVQVEHAAGDSGENPRVNVSDIRRSPEARDALDTLARHLEEANDEQNGGGSGAS